MGSEDDPNTVVDSRLRVKGIEGLRVADASVMPNLIRGHTMAPSVFIGYRAADIIAQDAPALLSVGARLRTTDITRLPRCGGRLRECGRPDYALGTIRSKTYGVPECLRSAADPSLIRQALSRPPSRCVKNVPTFASRALSGEVVSSAGGKTAAPS